MKYIPPFSLTEEMLEIISEIMEYLGRIDNVGDLDKMPKLRRVNRIKSVHASLAIENNTLSFEQVSAILNGKTILAPPDEILEVKNALAAYNEIDQVDPYSIKDTLKIHGILMRGLDETPGAFRKTEAGVFEGDKVIHVAPPAQNVVALMEQLFDWLKNTKAHPLIKSSVFHYEFEFIHPFADGNGRMGRLWQTIILSVWRPIFAWLPIESIIQKRQQEYYDALANSTLQATSNPFIMFMLKAILSSVKLIVEDTHQHLNHISSRVKKLMEVIQNYPMSANEIMKLLNLKSKSSFRQNYLLPAIEAGLIELTEPTIPTSKNQRYFKK